MRRINNSFKISKIQLGMSAIRLVRQVEATRLKHRIGIQNDTEPEPNPHHMLKRRFSIAALCMRRFTECRMDMCISARVN